MSSERKSHKTARRNTERMNRFLMTGSPMPTRIVRSDRIAEHERFMQVRHEQLLRMRREEENRRRRMKYAYRTPAGVKKPTRN